MTKAAGTDACAGTGVHAKKDAGVGAAAGAFANITRRDLLALAGLGLLGGGVAGIAGCSAAGTGGEVTRAVSGVEPIADASGWDSAYYVPKYASFDEARLASEEVAREAEAIGQEMLLAGMSGWCAPAMNCHRSPFGGRNFEYFSEDPLLAGTLAAAEVEGAFSCGVYSQMKHFCLNDQDTNRCAHLLTWASEQAIREIYARPFEIVVKRARGSVPYLDDATGERKEYEVGAAKAVMSSYNYIGSIWAGGCEALCTGLLRDEWGYDGHVVSDWTLYDYTDKNQAFCAGTDVNFTTTAQTGEMSDSDSATAILAMRRAMHRYLYSVANSDAVNGEAPAVCVTYK